MRRRVQYDIWYLENWSFLLDLTIIAKTVINAVKGEENAY
ncbi:MAG: sugar transferase [Chitinophagaceae bacterium]